jgi:hypothetical protein
MESPSLSGIEEEVPASQRIKRSRGHTHNAGGERGTSSVPSGAFPFRELSWGYAINGGAGRTASWCLQRTEGESPMPQQAWNAKRERQYEHIKDGLEERGDSEALASEIAARTVNKERARAGESEQASETSISDISSGRRGGLRSHKGSGGRTKAQLYEEARRKGVDGRSKMTKAELERAVDH